MHTLDDKNNHYKELQLFPDYSSSGIWCSCGLGISDPLEETNIPYHIVELVDGWNLLWEHMSMYPENISVENVEKKIISIGRILANQISKYTSCTLREDACRLNIMNLE